MISSTRNSVAVGRQGGEVSAKLPPRFRFRGGTVVAECKRRAANGALETERRNRPIRETEQCKSGSRTEYGQYASAQAFLSPRCKGASGSPTELTVAFPVGEWE